MPLKPLNPNMTTSSADSVVHTCRCSCGNRIPVDPKGGDGQSTTELERPRSQPVETKIFPAPKRHCNRTERQNDYDSNGNIKKTPLIQVIKSTNLRYDPDEDYKMTASPRGNCLIINNVVFETMCLLERKGSDKDALKFRDIFLQLGFHVVTKRNMPAESMMRAFRDKALDCHSRHDALVVILLSHGTESGIYGSDGVEVDLNDMLNCFDNKNCKQMIGKPKVFIVQACRGRQTDYGVKQATQQFLSQPESQGYTQPSQSGYDYCSSLDRTKISRWSEIDTEFTPTRTDMILCFSCHVGFGSIRNEEDGSWLGASLAQNLAKSAHKKHLMEIFNMVSRDVRLRQSTAGHKQVLEITTIGFDRNLYFNPGL